MSVLRDGIKHLSLDPRRDTLNQSAVKNLAETRAIQLCSMEPHTYTSSVSMEDLLYSHESAECSDFRDKIYALISLSPHAQTHLSVDYGIDRAQLMLRVLNFSQTYQNLSAFRTLSFASFLRNHLEVTTRELYDGILNPKTPSPSAFFTIRGTIPGRVEDLQPGCEMEEAALKVRHGLPALLSCSGLLLNDRKPSKTLEIDPDTIVATKLCQTGGIPGIDQCLFAFTGSEPEDSGNLTSARGLLPGKTTNNGPLLGGFASTIVKIDDEIWQFDRTPLAVIARKTSQGYVLVGRALLLRDLKATKRVSQFHLQDQISFINDGTKYPHKTLVISVDLKGLHELMIWINFDRRNKLH